MIRFRIDSSLAYDEGETVYHVGCGEFARVAGISSGRKVSVEIVRRDGAAYWADPAMLKQNVAEAETFADALRTVDVKLLHWFLDTWKGGEVSVEECRSRLRAAAGAVAAERGEVIAA